MEGGQFLSSSGNKLITVAVLQDRLLTATAKQKEKKAFVVQGDGTA
jgi:hypothetical protein